MIKVGVFVLNFCKNHVFNIDFLIYICSFLFIYFDMTGLNTIAALFLIGHEIRSLPALFCSSFRMPPSDQLVYYI